MKDEILKYLKRFDTLPFLFVGSGISRRYLDLENWEGLLRKFAKMAINNEFAYELYLQQAKTSDYKEGILPKIAELIEKDFNKMWFTDEKFRDSREQYKEEVLNLTSPFKIEIAKYMKEKSSDLNVSYRDEINTLQIIGKKSIGGLLTTNYDCFLENIFNDYTKYIGQEELIFSTIQGVAEIYKIHGCCTKPGSIIINENDYADFSDRNAYLAAKILTIFLEHPVIFIGYSISDINIENILKAIVKCLSADNLQKLKERLIFIEWNSGDQEDGISTYSKSFEGGKSIDMTRIKLKKYNILYQALYENKAKYNAPMLRRLKEDIYELVQTNKPTGKIRTVGLEDEKLNDVEVVIGVGVLAEFGQKGYAAVSVAELYTDVVFDKGDYDPDKIIQFTLPMLLSSNSNNLPVNKYISSSTVDIPEKILNGIKSDYDSLLNATIKKNRHRYHDYTIPKVINDSNLDQSLYIIPHLQKENIDVSELHKFLIDTIERNPNILTDKNEGRKSNLKRIIRIYDWIKYFNK